MAFDVPEVPPDVKREIGLSSAFSIIIAMMASTTDSFAGVSYGVPRDKYLSDIQTLCGALAGQGTKNLLESFKIPGNDCTTVAKVHQIAVDAMGFQPEIIEMTPEKAVVHEKKCWFPELCPGIFPTLLDAPVEKLACTAFDDAMGKTVNPKITFRRGETICKGGKICENIWELKE